MILIPMGSLQAQTDPPGSAAVSANEGPTKPEQIVFFKVFYNAQSTYRLDDGDRRAYIKYYSDWPRTGSYNADAEIPIYGDEYGIEFEFKFRHGFNFNTGLSVNNQGYTTEPTTVTTTYGTYAGGTPSSYSSAKQVIDSKFQFACLTTLLNFEFPHKERHYLYIGVGVQPRVLTKFSVSGISTSKGMNGNMGVFGLANLGANLALGPRFSIFVEPNIALPIGYLSVKDPVTGGGNFGVKLWSYGCKTGIKF